MLQCRRAEEFSFGPRALKAALLSADPALQQLYAAAFSPAERLFLAEAYNPRRTLFCSPRIRSAFDWLLSRPEPPEDFQAFHEALGRRKPSAGQKLIYLQPIDVREGRVGGSLLDSLRGCAEAFFPGLRVKCLPAVAAAAIRCHSRPGPGPGSLQLHTDGILSFLESNKPGDALCVLGLTLSDLYPCEAWSFTFGKSLPGHEVGVCSFARFLGDLPHLGPRASDPAPPEGAVDDPESPVGGRGQPVSFSALGVVHCCQVACHELCHLLGLGSCRWLRCLMQGALSLDEALRRPLDLCPVCLRKLQHVLGFRLVERYKDEQEGGSREPRRRCRLEADAASSADEEPRGGEAKGTAKKLYAWTDTVAGTWPSQEAGERSVSEDTLPFSSDSGVGCENDSEAVTSLSDPLTPDAGSHAFSVGPELEPEEGLSSLADVESQQRLCGAAEPAEAVREHGLWLAACIQALERHVSEEELARVDRAVDALARWDLFTGQLPATRQDLPCGRDGTGLRKVLGDKFSSLRKKFSRKPSKAESPPCRWKREED